MPAFMHTEQLLSFAESLRAYAQWAGRDLNAANLFVHDMLMRVIVAERERDDFEQRSKAA